MSYFSPVYLPYVSVNLHFNIYHFVTKIVNEGHVSLSLS